MHCLYLEELDLSDNNLGASGANAISRIYDNSTFNELRLTGLIEVFLNKTNLGDKGLITLIKSLSVVSYLEIADNDIGVLAFS